MRSFEEILEQRKDLCYELTLEEYYFNINKVKKSIYWFIIGKCGICGKDVRACVKSFSKRLMIENKNILFCSGGCASKFNSKQDSWRKKNSDAQKIAQNKPEQIEKNKQGVLRSRRDPVNYKKWYDACLLANRSEKRRKEASIHFKELWKNADFAKKIMNNAGGWHNSIKGIFRSKFSGEIFFDSSYELLFLIFMDLEKKTVKRFDGYIQYNFNDKFRRYFPDFVVENKIYEIKSNKILEMRQFGFEEMKAKMNHTYEFIKNNNYDDFFLLKEEELTELSGNIWYRKYLFSWMVDDGFIINHKNGSSLMVKKREGSYIANGAKEIYKIWNSLK
jgi:hypothetical protein